MPVATAGSENRVAGQDCRESYTDRWVPCECSEIARVHHPGRVLRCQVSVIRAVAGLRCQRTDSPAVHECNRISDDRPPRAKAGPSADNGSQHPGLVQGVSHELCLVFELIKACEAGDIKRT